MKVKIKKLHPDAKIPTYAKNGDAGMDLTATSMNFEGDTIVYGTGLAFEIPKGYVGLLFPRSSNSKQDLLLSNSVGVLDSAYRGEVMFKFKPTFEIQGLIELIYDTLVLFGIVERTEKTNTKCRKYELGDRIGQIIILPYPEIEFEETDELSETERGTGGYGHTGK